MWISFFFSDDPQDSLVVVVVYFVVVPNAPWKLMMVRKLVLFAALAPLVARGFFVPSRARVRAAVRREAAAADGWVTLFVECGFGNDSHGQNATKAAVRACRNAIEFNSIPSIGALVPGGYDGMELRVQIAAPTTPSGVDIDAVKAVFPCETARARCFEFSKSCPGSCVLYARGRECAFAILRARRRASDGRPAGGWHARQQRHRDPRDGRHERRYAHRHRVRGRRVSAADELTSQCATSNAPGGSQFEKY